MKINRNYIEQKCNDGIRSLLLCVFSYFFVGVFLKSQPFGISCGTFFFASAIFISIGKVSQFSIAHAEFINRRLKFEVLVYWFRGQFSRSFSGVLKLQWVFRYIFFHFSGYLTALSDYNIILRLHVHFLPPKRLYVWVRSSSEYVQHLLSIKSCFIL